MHDTIKRLERQVARVQTLQFVLLAIIFLLVAVVAVYVPKFENLSALAGACQQGTAPAGQPTPGRGV